MFWRRIIPVWLTPEAWEILILYRMRWGRKNGVFNDHADMVEFKMYKTVFNRFMQHRMAGEDLSDTIVRKLKPGE